MVQSFHEKHPRISVKGLTIFVNKNNTTKNRKAPPKINIISSSDNLTSQAGLIPAVHFLDKLDFMGLTKQFLYRQRAQQATYQFSDTIYLAVIAILGGATSILAIPVVWADRVLQELAGVENVPDQSILNRIFHLFTFAMVSSLEALNHRMRERAWKKAFPNETDCPWAASDMWIDADSTVKTVFGSQEGAEKGYNPHKRGAKSYHPLLAFCATTKEILQGWFRCGSAYTSNGTVEFLRQLLVQLPTKVRIVFRCDSGFFDGAILDYLESRGNGFLIKAKMKNLKTLLSSQVWATIPKQEGWESCEFFYACGGWKKNRRFVAVRREVKEEKADGQLKLFESKTYDYFCYAVSEPLTPWETHKKYGERATCETWIDEAKNQMGLANIKTSEFWANSALFQCAVLAYNTVCWMRICSGNATLKQWEIKTIRTFLVRVAGKLVKGGRQLTLKTPSTHLFMGQWEAWVKLGMP